MLTTNLTKIDHRILCAFCRGTGKDRFGIMSALSTCSVCHGHRFHKITTPVVRCAYCRGTGVSPIGGRNSCLACGGKGAIARSSPQNQRCSSCRGSGTHQATGFYCYPCHGSGLKQF